MIAFCVAFLVFLGGSPLKAYALIGAAEDCAHYFPVLEVSYASLPCEDEEPEDKIEPPPYTYQVLESESQPPPYTLDIPDVERTWYLVQGSLPTLPERFNIFVVNQAGRDVAVLLNVPIIWMDHPDTTVVGVQVITGMFAQDFCPGDYSLERFVPLVAGYEIQFTVRVIQPMRPVIVSVDKMRLPFAVGGDDTPTMVDCVVLTLENDAGVTWQNTFLYYSVDGGNTWNAYPDITVSTGRAVQVTVINVQREVPYQFVVYVGSQGAVQGESDIMAIKIGLDDELTTTCLGIGRGGGDQGDGGELPPIGNPDPNPPGSGDNDEDNSSDQIGNQEPPCEDDRNQELPALPEQPRPRPPNNHAHYVSPDDSDGDCTIDALAEPDIPDGETGNEPNLDVATVAADEFPAAEVVLPPDSTVVAPAPAVTPVAYTSPADYMWPEQQRSGIPVQLLISGGLLAAGAGVFIYRKRAVKKV